MTVRAGGWGSPSAAGDRPSTRARGPRGPFAPEDARGPHGPRTSALFSQQPAAGDAGLDTERAAKADSRPDNGTGPSDEASVTDDGLDVAREALRIFAEDLTDESAARLKAVVDGADGYEWGGLA